MGNYLFHVQIKAGLSQGICVHKPSASATPWHCSLFRQLYLLSVGLGPPWSLQAVFASGVHKWCPHVVFKCGVHRWCAQVMFTLVCAHKWCTQVVCTNGLHKLCSQVVITSHKHKRFSRVNMLTSGLHKLFSQVVITSDVHKRSSQVGVHKWFAKAQAAVDHFTCNTICTICVSDDASCISSPAGSQMHPSFQSCFAICQRVRER